jgi:methylated-DNA-[protein]-cysteine S-methyltransferase
MPDSYETIETGFGMIGLVWKTIEGVPTVRRVFLPDAQMSMEAQVQAGFPGSVRATHPTIAALGEQIRRFLKGEPITFDLDAVHLDACSDFQQQVLIAEHAIPRGWVSTYGRIAKHLGVERGGRAVGNALARNPFPLLIPCHRAIRSDGTLGGYQGGLPMKRALLEMEGVEFSENGKARTSRFHY